MNQLLRGFVAAALVSAVAGCATHPTNAGVSALQAGDLRRAEILFQEGIDKGDVPAINNMGVLWQRRGDRERAAHYYRRAARYGYPLAQQNLRALGEDVPEADLAALTPSVSRSTPQRSWGDVLRGLAPSAGAGYLASRPGALQSPRPMVIDSAWDWDQFIDENGRWVWACRGIQTGQFAHDSYCQGLIKVDSRWPGVQQPLR